MAGKKLLRRELYCGEINESHLGKNVTVYGWINKKRELGGLTFLDLRDREGILQIVIDENFKEKNIVKDISNEYVISVSGEIVKRSNPNPEMFTGNIELLAKEITVLNSSLLPPFFPENNDGVSEELRFKYRYLDLRSKRLQKNFKIRSEVNLKVRNYLSSAGFMDIGTPMLTKATPEGARDYLVPSRVYKGKVFALPQSPQLFKQLLMISGFERYYQIVKCFRDEDLRADRQPEFTQIDIEMSFGEPEELFEITEGLIKNIFSVAGKKTENKFRTISYKEAMEKYGTDKPDLRIPLEIKNFTKSAGKLGSNILDSIINKGNSVEGLVLENGADYSRKRLDEINEYVRESGGAGAIWMKFGENGYKSSLKLESSAIENFFNTESVNRNNIVFLIGGKKDEALLLTGKLREYLGKSMIDKDRLEFLWVVDFPLFFYNEEEERYDSNHHPFTSPKLEDIEFLDSDPLKVNSIAYDLVLNGVEIGGGSRRINDVNLQKKIFKLLKLSDREIEYKFGFFIDALQYGAPPHLGIALGMDRIVMLLTGEESIREVISFPKTTSSLCLLTGSPSTVSEKQLNELGIKFSNDQIEKK